MDNAFTIDLEYWWCNEYLKGSSFERKDLQITESTNILLNVLEKNNTKATFFVLGEVAEKHPEMIKKIYDEGHEIASHGYSHMQLFKLGKDRFEDELDRSIKILSKITGEKPRGFRSPSFSLDNSTGWALDVLEKYNFSYDSSVFPVYAGLYGIPNAPLTIYKPSKDDITQEDSEGKIIEFPLSLINHNHIKIPISGGFYLRTLPTWYLKRAIKKVSKERPFILYIHPREINSNTPKIPLNLKSNFIVYHGVNTALGKIKTLLQEFKFRPAGEIIDEI